MRCIFIKRHLTLHIVIYGTIVMNVTFVTNVTIVTNVAIVTKVTFVTDRFSRNVAQLMVGVYKN